MDAAVPVADEFFEPLCFVRLSVGLFLSKAFIAGSICINGFWCGCKKNAGYSDIA